MRTMMILLFLSGMLLAADVNFSGVWELDKSKSELPESGGHGGRGGFTPLKLVVSQEEGKIVIERHIKDRDGEERVVASNLTLDGKEVKEKDDRGERKVKAELRDDVLLLDSILYMERRGHSFEITTRQKWSLDDSGKGLVIDFSMDTPKGERKGRGYYKRVQDAEVGALRQDRTQN